MKGHIRKRSAGSWSVVVEMPRDSSTGKRRQAWHTIKGNKRDAERYLREILSSVEQGRYVKTNRITFGEWLRQWLSSFVSMQATQRTVESYTSNVERHIIPALGKVPLAELEPSHLQEYYCKAIKQGRFDQKGGLSARTVLYHHRIISKSLNQAMRMGLVVRNVAVLVDPPRVKKSSFNVLYADDISKLLDALHKTDFFVYY
jgi:integrase